MSVFVTYIGKSVTWVDNAYGSGMVFEQFETYKVDDLLAKRLLKHTDCFVVNENGSSGSTGNYDDSAILRRISSIETVNQTQTNMIDELQGEISANLAGDATLESRVDALEEFSCSTLSDSDIDNIIYGV